MSWLRPWRQQETSADLLIYIDLVADYIAHFVFGRKDKETFTCLCPYKLTSAYMCIGYTVHVCVSGALFSLSGRQTGRADQGHCLRGILEKCFSAVGEKKYERDPKSRHRAPWIMSAAELKKSDETICSSIWMANWLTVLLTQAEEVWRGCED